MRLFREAFLAEERHVVRSERIKRGQECGHDGDAQNDREEGLVATGFRTLEQGDQNFVFAPEAGQQRAAGQRQRADQERQSRVRHHMPQAAEARMSITSPIECITLPAPRNNNALKKACVKR